MPCINVLERSVANQQPLADKEPVHDGEEGGMDRQPALPASILDRGSLHCRHEVRAVGSHTRLRIESSVQDDHASRGIGSQGGRA
jgi:hypothetical protein